MNLNALDARLRKAEDEAARLRGEVPATAREAEERRMTAVAELSAAGCVAAACGHDIQETAKGLVGRFRALPEEEWPSVFGEARARTRRITSDRNWPACSAALEALIEAVKGS